MIQTKKKITAGLMIIASCLFFTGVVFCAQADKETNKEVAQDDTKGYAGEFFDAKVPRQNYYFVKNALIVFGNRGGSSPKADKEKEEYIWDQLLLSYVAFRGNVVVTQEEVDQEVAKILGEYKVDFDPKANKDALSKWVQEKAGEPVELFENQIRHLLQLEKSRQQIIDSIQPNVTDQEAHQEFSNEYSSLSVELSQFDQQNDAQDFYQKVKRKPKFWNEEKKRRPDAFRQPGFVSLIFLMDIWKLPQDAVSKMVHMSKGEFYPPSPVYKGYAVFQVLETRPAKEADYAKVKNNYFDKVKRRKQYEGYNEWFKNLKQQAKIKIYENKKEEK